MRKIINQLFILIATLTTYLVGGLALKIDLTLKNSALLLVILAVSFISGLVNAYD